jgi:hypothetical protein
MVNYNGQNPAIPGNASLEPSEAEAFWRGNTEVVREIGMGYGVACYDYGLQHPDEERVSLLVGAKALSGGKPTTLAGMQMHINFIEGIQAGVQRRGQEIRDAIAWREENPKLYELYAGMAALREFGKRPEVQRIVQEQSRAAFDKLVSAVKTINRRLAQESGEEI